MKRFAGFLVALVLLVAGTSQAYADHIIASTLNWEPVAGSPNTIRFLGTVYFRTDQIIGTGGLSADSNLVAIGNVYCEPVGAGGLILYYGDGGNTGDLCFRIQEVNHIEGWVRALAVISTNTAANGITHTFATAGPYSAEILGCCRIDNQEGAKINNRPEEPFRLMTTVRYGTNISPVVLLAGQLPIRQVPQACASGEFITFPMQATDPNGNPIAWSLTTDIQATNHTVSPGPASEAGFPGLAISSAGIVKWYNFGVNNLLPWTVQFYACDNQGTCSPVDFLLLLQACNFETGDGCTGTLGYWKNHSDAWPVDAITVGGVSYTKAQAIAWLQTPPKGNEAINLFHQLVAAMLNVLHGADNSCIQQTITDANAFLSSHPITVSLKGSSNDWKNVGAALHSKLGNYNEGKLCAPHRDSGDCEEGSDLQ